MDINHIELSPQSVAELYASVLVQSDDNISSFSSENGLNNQKDASPANRKSLGNNQKNILIIVNNENVVYLPDNELALLTSILNACKLTVADVAIVNMNNNPGAGYKDFTTHFNSKHALLFNIEPSAFGLPMSFPHFQVQSFNNCTYLFSPPLSEIEAEKELKRKLWECLKRIFGI